MSEDENKKLNKIKLFLLTRFSIKKLTMQLLLLLQRLLLAYLLVLVFFQDQHRLMEIW